VNGDGYSDIIASAELYTTGTNAQGAVYILFRDASNAVTSVAQYSNGANGIPSDFIDDFQRFGSKLAWIGAWGDGTNALAVGCAAYGGDGAVFLLGFSSSGSLQWHEKFESGTHGLPIFSEPAAFGSGLGVVDLDG